VNRTGAVATSTIMNLIRWGSAIAIVGLACGPGSASTSGDGGGSGSGGDVSASEGTTASASTGGDSSGVVTSMGASESTTTGGVANVCPCTQVPAEDPYDCSYELVGAELPHCGWAPICDEVTVDCARAGTDLYDCTAELVYAEEALACALTALRDRTNGALLIEGDTDFGLYTDQSKTVIWILPDDVAATGDCFGTDVGGEWTHVYAVTLAPADHFADCLDLAAPSDRYDCLFAGVSNEATPLSACG